MPVLVDEVALHSSVPAVDRVLGWRMEVVLDQLVALAADQRGAGHVVRGHHLHHVARVLHAELEWLVLQHDRRAVMNGQAIGHDVDRRLAGTRSAGWESDITPVARSDRRRRVVIPRAGRRRLGSGWLRERDDAAPATATVAPPAFSSVRRVISAMMPPVVAVPPISCCSQPVPHLPSRVSSNRLTTDCHLPLLYVTAVGWHWRRRHEPGDDLRLAGGPRSAGAGVSGWTRTRPIWPNWPRS